MPIQYINSPERDFSSGIDVRSSENQIDPGFVRDLLNADIVEKRVRNRRGYQGYAGNLPIRVMGLEYSNSDNQVCVTLDTSISLESARSSPIIIYGRSSEFTSGQGPITDVDSAHYYPAFTVPVRKQFTAPSGTLTIPGTEHALDSYNLFVGVVESTSPSDRSHSHIEADTIDIDETSFDIDVGYTTYATRDVFIYYANKDAISGSSYIAPISHTGSGSETFTVTAATHGLSNFNVIPQVYQDTGTDRQQVTPDQLIVQSDGDVEITLFSSSAAIFYLILSAGPVANMTTGTIAASSTQSLTISNVENPWAFFGVYLEQSPGGDKELVIPDSVTYDETSNSYTITFTNGMSTAGNFFVFYEYGTIRSNQLCVTDTSVTVDGTDAYPQLSIWGLDSSEIYLNRSAREGWVTHIDSYKRSGEQRLISGLGGNLFSAREYSEAYSQYLYPLLYPYLSARTAGSRILGPLFHDTGDTPARTRGYITADDSGTGWATASAVEFDTGNEWTRYTIDLPNMAILDSAGSPTAIGSVISTTANLEDWLTVQGMSYARHNGTFRIRQITSGADQIYVWVENDSNAADWDDPGTAGQCGVFTEHLVWTTTGRFIPEDTLVSDSLGLLISQVISGSGTTTIADGFVDIVSIAGGVVFTGERTSNVIPLRTGAPTSTANTDNLVRGDMISYLDIDRLLRVQYINSDSDRTVGISVSSGEATVTLASGDTSYLSVGMYILLLNAGKHTGVHQITEIVSPTQFSYTTEETDSVVAAILSGETAQIDENLQWQDSIGDVNYFRCESRWVPLEAPDDSFNLTPSTHVRYLDKSSYSNQPFLRSTMVVDNMYFTNGEDEVYKLDGSSIYRPGLINWQPGLFVTQETSGPTIVVDLRSIAYSAISAASGRLTITAATQSVVPVGTSVRLSGSTQTYTVREYANDGTNYYLLVDRALDGSVSASGTASEIGTYRYYFRLNAVDANSNVVASAVTGSQDHVVELTSNASITLRLVGFPTWDVYDYDRLEVQIYRTLLNQVAPYYLVSNIPMSFDISQGYVQYTDSFADSDLSQLDPVNTALKGTELGTGWSGPLRSKYITSIGNRLVLANLRDYPQLDIQIVGDATLSNSTLSGDNLLFRRDNSDTGTSTNMVDRIRYEWVNGTTGTASSFSIGTNQFSFTTSSATGAQTGDWIYLTYSTVATTGRNLTYSGWWQIASVVTTAVTVNLTGAAVAATYPNRYVIATDPTDIPVLLGVDGNLGQVNGDSFDTFDSMRRMSMAINSTMRMVDTGLSGYEPFIPWLSAQGGNDLSPAGRLIVRQQRADDVTPEVLLTFSGYSLFVNSIRRTTGDSVSASTRVFPSRIIVSYENYPEIFDSPTSVLDTDSDSAIDINSADGQAITGIIPFFGEAAFGAAQQSAVLLVFKSNSIYLVDINEKFAGRNPVQRIETEGLGCTAPNSIAVTKNGVMFANESGIYCLRRNQAIEYIGKYMERNWTERVSLDSLELAQGHHYGVGRVYKLSVPLISTINGSTGYLENSEVYVYNHTSESEGKHGAWARYDNHPATGWANLAPNAFFSSTGGRVFSVRNTGSDTDFRDDSSPIQFRLTTRPNDFGDSGIRKILDKALVHYRTNATNTGTTVSYAIDLEQEYRDTTPIVIAKPTESTGTSDRPAQDIVTIRHSLGRRRGVYFNLQIANSTLDESIEIAGIDYKVGGLTDKGILSAQKSLSTG